jgi:hypothetical protein
MNGAQALAAAVRGALTLPYAVDLRGERERARLATARSAHVAGALKHLAEHRCAHGDDSEHDAGCVDLAVAAIEDTAELWPVTYQTSGGET